MSEKTDLYLETELVQTLSDYVQVYEEVGVLKMQRVRSSVLATRKFMDGIAEIFKEIKNSYQQQVMESLRKSAISEWQREADFSILKRTKDSVAVLLSATEKLSGAVNEEVFDLFWSYIKNHPGYDVIIAGNTGRKLYSAVESTRPYRYFDLPERTLSIDDLRPIIESMIEYKQVKVFTGKFNNFVNQQGAMYDISGVHAELNKGIQIEGGEKKRYLFEPSLEEILRFFETQIFKSLFKQTVHESYLAQLGSRLMALEQISNNLDERLQKLSFEKRKYVRQLRNKKQLRALAGFSFWSAS